MTVVYFANTDGAEIRRRTAHQAPAVGEYVVLRQPEGEARSYRVVRVAWVLPEVAADHLGIVGTLDEVVHAWLDEERL